MSAIGAGVRPVQAMVVLRGVEVHCDDARFPDLLGRSLAAADLHLPPIEIAEVRVRGPVSWRAGLLGVERYSQMLFNFTISAGAPVERDALLRAIARAVFGVLTMRVIPLSGWFGGSLVTMPRDAWTLYQRFLGRSAWYDVFDSGRVVIGAPTAAPSTPSPSQPSQPSSSHVVVVPEIAVGVGRAEWQLSRAEIVRYQTILYNLGELGSPQDADGLVGPTTRTAIREFQHVYNRRQSDPSAASRLWDPRSLLEDGILGPETQRALDQFAGYRHDGAINGWAAL